MGCGASTHGALAPRRRGAEDKNEKEQGSDAVLKVLHEGIQRRGPKAAALGAPFIQSPDACKPLDALPDCLYELHYSMPQSIMEAPMRLLKIGALRKWRYLKVYEEVNPETECLQLPYTETDDGLWRRVATVSWRWGYQKPDAYKQGFSPMTERQFQELVELLQITEDGGIEFVWIDWSCVPQNSEDSMVEVHRSKVFYARARLMLVLPNFHSLPDEGPVRVILAKALRELKARAAAANSIPCTVAASIIEAILAKNIVAGREYFGRVWTLAERMARYGGREGLCHWLSLESWLGMVVHAMLQSTEDKASSIIYKKMLGEEVAALLDSVLEPLAAAVRIGGVQARACDGLEVKVADLCLAAVGVWLSPTRLLVEAPTRQWLHIYLGDEARSGIYHAWSEADRIWAIYSYFCWKRNLDQRSVEGLRTALEALVEIASSGDTSGYLNGMYAQLGIGGTGTTSRLPAGQERQAEERGPKQATESVEATTSKGGGGFGQQGQERQAEERGPKQATGSAEATTSKAEEKDGEGPAACGDSGVQWIIIDREHAKMAWRYLLLTRRDGSGEGGQRGGGPSSASTQAADQYDDTTAADGSSDGDSSSSAADLPDRDNPEDVKLLVEQLSSSDRRVQEAAAGLVSWVINGCSWVHPVMDAGGMPPLVSLLSSAETAVQRLAAKTLFFIFNQTASYSVTFMKEVGGIPPLVRLLDSPEPRVQQAAAEALGELARGWDDEMDLADLAEAVAPLVKQLSSADTGVQEEAAGTLGWFAYRDMTTHKLNITEAGAIPPLLKLLSSPEKCVASSAASALKDLAEGGESNQVAIIQAGAIPCLVALLGSSDREDKHGSAVNCLAALAVNPSGRDAILSAGGIPPLLDYLIKADAWCMVDSAAGALRDLSADSICQREVAAHGIPRLIEVLEDDSADVWPQCHAAKALRILAENAANRASIAEWGGIIGTLLGLLSSSEWRCREDALKILDMLAQDADSQVAIAEAGGIPLLVKLLDYGYRGVAESAASVLGSLACNASNQVAIAQQEGVIPKLVERLNDWRWLDYCEGPVWALRNLALNSANQVSIAEAGGIPPLVKLLGHKDTGVQQQAAAALGNLALNSANQVSIAEAGGIPPLVKLLGHTDTGVQQQAAAALGNLALNSVNQAAIAQAGGIPELMKLVSSSDAGVKGAAAGALGSLALNAKNKVTIALLAPPNTAL